MSSGNTACPTPSYTTTMFVFKQSGNNNQLQLLHHKTKNQNHKTCYSSSTSVSSIISTSNFQMPLHYPRYKKSDYETMPEWKLDCLLKQYGLPVIGDVDNKRKFAMGAFLWPDQRT
ncbi:hypothetical protein A4A49_55495 [Nicotiana attenuata]|uniref:DUF7722 domain-containing protein n=1 Tax=Nicotiana attenuata TaxID=49451 RepID=A0A1J6IIJ0_NICAT|nr:hypothetical protein A4A49_55495 [Nicotiana attenuata]